MLNLIHFINISHYFFLTTEQEGSGTDGNDVINNNNGVTTDDEDGFEGSAETEVSFSIPFDYNLMDDFHYFKNSVLNHLQHFSRFRLYKKILNTFKLMKSLLIIYFDSAFTFRH